MTKEEAEDEEDEEDAAFALALAHKLINPTSYNIPSHQSAPEQSVIWHEDLSLSNILINEQGEITALLDWECVSAMPLWMVTVVPEFLQDQCGRKNQSDKIMQMKAITSLACPEMAKMMT